ncbi:TOG array regulator of axonemal microtubules protein 2 [Apus apus]|uniref:TOG array regulator of axonemal microtubules protein 2 n=1 Tax=Apus apus TaxID=8895 RepID=UPI0021F87778|nr:TOG array regulator of axonemal microtubules protein 2 [Apus apus]
MENRVKCHGPVAVYCGIIPKFKPRYAALQGRSIDLDLQFCSSVWATGEEGLPLSQAEEMDHLVRPHLPSDDDLKDSVDPLPVNGTVSMFPRITNARRENTGTAFRKQVNRPSLPSLPVTKQGGSFPHNNSVNSLMATALDSLGCGEETGCGDTWGTRPRPQQMLLATLTLLSSDDWEQQVKGLFDIRCLANCHSEVLLSRLHDVSVAITKEVNNLRSKVSRSAVITLGELFRTLKHHMDHEVAGIASVLLQKTGESSEFIREAASQSLGTMVVNVTPERAMTALMATGVWHCNVLVRKCAAKHLLTLVEQIGAGKLLSGTRDRTQPLVHTLVKLAQDCHQDTRCYGRQMLNILMSHPKFDRYLKQCGPSRDLEEIMATIKKRGIEDHRGEPPAARDPRESKNSNSKTSQDKLPPIGGLKPGPDVTLPPQKVPRTSLCTVEATEQLLELNGLLKAQEFQSRMKGLELLLDHCKSSPQFISTNIVQVFDVFVLTLQDCHKKVNQRALEVLALMIPVLRGALQPIMVSLVTAIIDNLNSKHLGIYAAAVKVLEASRAHLDNTSLLQLFASRVPYLTGQALLDVTEYLSVLVESSYPRKPQAIQRYALPALWYLLGNRALPVLKAVVTKLAKSLYQVMGSRLKEQATKQPPHVAKNLWDILEMSIG